MKVTIKEVAREANVSPSTVSRVISNSSQISEETKERVREAINKLKYKPNAIARSLANQKSRILGVVLPNESQDLITNTFFIQAMKGMSRYAQNKKYYITYAFSEDEKTELEYINNFITSNLVDGICLLRARADDKSIKFLKDAEFPFVVIGRPEEADGVLWVDNDNFQATYNLVNELIKKGHKSIAFLGAKKEWNVTKDRFNGFKVACEINGISIQDKMVVMMNDFNEDEGKIGAIKLLENATPTAIIAEDDILAFGILKVLREKNIKNIEVVGFNNNPLSEFQNPSLSSIDINADELGYFAVKILIEHLEKSEMLINHHIVDSKLIKRESFK
ncbi:LacI family DNA-binding transcriptional regulator [Clostridium saccharoperbutylacetonicum]|uniref:HTH-type transcriptional regulator MalR n=1 Tax=Clostridium saccharoperbutylacetonicum N1-4(HMT) TaxID=931276 RepID=M1LMS3_9CLOT|nr:LacI family DNA-binding transcriptional regulator [Clostridium saccharoperbutylacetonicum]AGF54105.1 HTH-type transcriptional regulator MalR [Clostridium saccharoperbutylacetonicum N1-4(HMT)]AQR93009.1 HTH-type transcriptional regulator MalR [Clostridium saccharoperbutylacetonicum]NRT59382.1 DNA-binding LacI/PurR family transcriptional regulator [Clostridium saccharoperbutylacetonicum]NSB28573.1 DNA-binding LacI/PurR family transcriptional regulator [Clostridium saccharoperbutylacetonicum]N